MARFSLICLTIIEDRETKIFKALFQSSSKVLITYAQNGFPLWTFTNRKHGVIRLIHNYTYSWTCVAHWRNELRVSIH